MKTLRLILWSCAKICQIFISKRPSLLFSEIYDGFSKSTIGVEFAFWASQIYEIVI